MTEDKNLVPVQPDEQVPNEPVVDIKQKRKTRKFIVIVFGIALQIILALGLISILIVWGQGPLAQDKIILVDHGMGVRAIADKLYQENVIYSRPLFAIGVLMAGHRSELKAGEYAFKSGQPMAAVINELVHGETYIRTLSIPEGLTVKQIVKIVDNAPSLEGEIPATLPQEGSLLPATYYYSWGGKKQLVLSRMQKNAAATLAEMWSKRDPNIAVTTQEQALVLASIVERETSLPNERARIAGVFYNRLKLGMKLQSDPTVIYAISDGLGVLDRPLWRSDWKFESPYNTYYITGLPPAPIANPGRAAIEAVLHPETNNYLYFVADGSGGHAFSETLDEHNKNIELRKKNLK